MISRLSNKADSLQVKLRETDQKKHLAIHSAADSSWKGLAVFPQGTSSHVNFHLEAKNGCFAEMTAISIPLTPHHPFKSLPVYSPCHMSGHPTGNC